MRKRRTFTAEFKREAVRQLEFSTKRARVVFIGGGIVERCWQHCRPALYTRI
jgi:hypothetical protein